MAINKDNLRNLLSLDGETFVKSVYWNILLREADREGTLSHVNALEHGMSKERMIFEMRVSEEGFLKEVPFDHFNIHEIEIERLLPLENDKFLDTAYIAILGRMADEEGKKTYLENMNKGTMDKIDVLFALRYSEEGKELGVDVKGLDSAYKKKKKKQFIMNVPIIGRGIRFLWRLRHLEQIVNVQLSLIGHRIDGTEDHVDSTKHLLEDTKHLLEDMQHQIEKLESELIYEKMNRCKSDSFATGIAYKEYEDKMRGSREEIIERLNIYEAIIKKVKENNGEKLIALDLGCGRGEWLELMEKTYNITALGVDSDESMLSDCEKYSLNAINADLLAYIKNAESNSVDIITMIQVVEHLPASILVDVLNECYRVMRKGGAIILETPNPENIIIGACNFYFDPTHITKLPPVLLQILAESTGFSDTEIVRMHLYNAIDVDGLKQDNPEQTAIKQMAGFFNNFADYAVTAFKR